MASVAKDQAAAQAAEIELSLTLGNLEDIERWILSWGSHAQVLAPPELKERIARTAATVADSYRDAA